MTLQEQIDKLTSDERDYGGGDSRPVIRITSVSRKTWEELCRQIRCDPYTIAYIEYANKEELKSALIRAII